MLPSKRRHTVENEWLWNDEAKGRHADFLREAEEARQILRSKRVSKLPAVLKGLLLFVITIA
jgi:hypothetical protein